MPQRSREQEAQLEEKRSLDALKVFVAHTCEVLGMWRILCEHQFHVVADVLSKVREVYSMSARDCDARFYLEDMKQYCY
jgi:nuclear pore complex protein Nup155